MLLLAILPGLLWQGGAASTVAAQTPCVYALEQKAQAPAGCQPVQLSQLVKLPTPGVNYRTNVAAATSTPWVNSNGGRLIRQPKAQYLYKPDPAAVTLAMAEAHAFGVEAVMDVPGEGMSAYQDTLAFLRQADEPALPVRANLSIEDDGTPLMGEVLNLLTRRNLPYTVGGKQPGVLHVALEKGGYTRKDASDPYMFVQRLRQDVTDEKRAFRIYGSEVVVGRLLSDGKRARLHLLNYSNRPVEGLRIRVMGKYTQARALVMGKPQQAVEDHAVLGQATELSLPWMGTYAIIDLQSR